MRLNHPLPCLLLGPRTGPALPARAQCSRATGKCHVQNRTLQRTRTFVRSMVRPLPGVLRPSLDDTGCLFDRLLSGLLAGPLALLFVFCFKKKREEGDQVSVRLFRKRLSN